MDAESFIPNSLVFPQCSLPTLLPFHALPPHPWTQIALSSTNQGSQYHFTWQHHMEEENQALQTKPLFAEIIKSQFAEICKVQFSL